MSFVVCRLLETEGGVYFRPSVSSRRSLTRPTVSLATSLSRALWPSLTRGKRQPPKRMTSRQPLRPLIQLQPKVLSIQHCHGSINIMFMDLMHISLWLLLLLLGLGEKLLVRVLIRDIILDHGSLRSNSRSGIDATAGYTRGLIHRQIVIVVVDMGHVMHFHQQFFFRTEKQLSQISHGFSCEFHS